MISVKNLYKSFGEKVVLHDISVDFKAGENNLVIGLSGSGKTVLMKCLVGLVKPEHGQILFNGRDLVSMTGKEQTAIRQDIGMVFQGGALFDSLTVEENVVFPLDMYTDMTLEEKIDRANFCLHRVNLENANKLYPSELSGGMKKRVAIARAIANNPKYLFCDEPNSGLDPRTSAVIDELISEITKEYNMTTIINTHDMNSVLQIGENVVFIYKGNLWWRGDKRSICETDNPELIEFLCASELTKRLIE
ncbi:MAG: ATP-binding cassette domain-containing protein [Bacteroidales bacterium]|jgi:phospholipid/cholesterol/gamma-HCH transport system ATP-binding protein|nr:ATP-binding cassette domain-containing protein [Bacteroidales bacterium]